jgi:ATP-binding cassette subfamily C protein CydCD
LIGDIVVSLLGIELPSDSPLENADVFATGLEGLHTAPILVGEQFPALAANTVAALLATPWMFEHVPGQVAEIGFVSMIGGTLAVVGALAATARWATGVHKAFTPIYDDLAAAVGGRLELVAGGRIEQFQRRVSAHVIRWQREAVRAAIRMALAGRAPVAVALAVAALTMLIEGIAHRGLARGLSSDILLLASVAPAFLGLMRGPFDIARSTAVLQPFFALLDHKVAKSLGSADLPQLPAPIECHEVSFAYRPLGTEGQFVLRNFTAVWSPGVVLGVQGANGTGKSTLLRLLLGIGKPSSGRITVGDADLSSLDMGAWRRAVGYLPQRPFLPERASVREAIRFLVEECHDDFIRTALERVDLWSALVRRCPVDPLSVCVEALSAGQRQRLALARLLCLNVRILLLDEPESDLDAAGISLVAALVRDLATDRMVAFAAHTPKMLAVADQVIVLGAAETARSSMRPGAEIW